MENNVVKTIIGAVALSSSAVAGTIEDPISIEQQYHTGDFCTVLEDIGTIYKNKENRYIQEVSFFGRFQAQYGYVDGQDVDGDGFNETSQEIRRFRAGLKIKAFNGFQLKGNVNLIDDDNPSGGERSFGYQDFDQLQLSYTKKDYLGFDSLVFSYGRHKIAVGHEGATSSKKIKTVERSAIANKLTNNRYTGLTVTGKRNNIEGTLGFLSLDQNDILGNWGAGNAIYASTEFQALRGDIRLDAFYNLDDGSSDDEVGVGYEWAFSAAWEGKIGTWDLAVNAIVGDNGDTGNDDRDGTFYGIVIMPSKEIIEDKLEFVTRYQFQGSSEDEGVRLNSRAVRNAASVNNADINGGRGDAHHSIYAGLNYYLCGHRSKILAGVEYDTISAPDGNVDATTLWLAFRTYF